MTDTLSGNAQVEGTVAPGFEPVAAEFGRLLETERDARGQFCAYLRGERVVDLWGGAEVAADDLQGFWSSTKGVSATCIALLVQRGALDLDAPVSRYWPEFAAAGKAGITVRVALSHQAGLVGVEPQLSLADSFDQATMAPLLAAQLPHWVPGKAHGYHGLTIGTIMDELVRRIEGVPIAEFFRTEIGDPRGIDLFIRTPEDVDHRVRRLDPAYPAPAQQGEPSGPSPTGPDSLLGMAFNAAVPDPSDELLPNRRAVRDTGQAAAGGVGSARGLARLYAMTFSEVDGFPPLLTPDTIAQVTQIQTVGHDLILGRPTRYGIVFQKADDHLTYGSHQAFGHDGAGGSIGVADPWHALAYAWIPRRMTNPGGADHRALSLAEVTRAAAATS